jgi:hypothetical protein
MSSRETDHRARQDDGEVGHDNDDEKPLLQTMDVMIPFLTQLRVLLANSSTLRPALFPVVEQETPSIHTLPVRKAFSLASTATAATDVHPSTDMPTNLLATPTRNAKRPRPAANSTRCRFCSFS